MKTFDVQAIGIHRPASAVFAYVSDPTNLPSWTNAFARADQNSAELVTESGTVSIKLDTIVHKEAGTIDWKMTFPGGMVGWAYSRVTPEGKEGAVYSFVLMAPPVPLEILEGALAQQMKTLAMELLALKERLEI